MTIGLVIGATGGIGGACATALAGSVETLIATGRDPAKLKQVAATASVIADVADPAGRAAVIDAVRAAGAPLRWVIIASGAPLRGPLAELSEADIAATYASNLVGPTLLVRALGALAWTIPASLVIIGSTSATRALANRSVYAASKAGLEHLAKSVAAEWAPRGIRVTVVAPGIVATPFLGADTSRLDGWTRERVPARRTGRPQEVAALVRYVALDAPDYLVGARIAIDGGLETLA
jgi:NAD(P)-dependent dehydrogenase (short-subunit alcohol dehydrogenase family)